MNTIDDRPPTSSLGVVQNDVDRVLRYDGDAPIPTDFLRDISLLGASTCLLYTSPSPRDQRGSRMPSSA